ncbi:hypothetical protein MBRA1_000665 [Malassezia brasiliensis]|uniref:Nuclear pore complex protein Nup85 n=1 Tax=Malassezia brasiliensis TaxID=1821822 RepID=A0AAF0IRK9_9BASI|nr:hypothetical protein MBRA1_000665 [Malassezia brasiliensis]
MTAETDSDASARTQFYTQSFTIFTSLQSIAASQQQEDHGEDAAAWLAAGPSVQTMQYYYRIGTLYCDTIQAYIDALEADSTSDTEYLKHIQTLQTLFHLAQVLYLPEDGRGMGVIGEELLHWLNAHDIAPTTEQGQQIAQTSPSYDHPEFWDYLFRCVLRGFYTTAATVLQSYHAPGVSPTLQSIATETAQILKSLPRSTGYATEPAFFSAHRNWHTSVRVFLSGLQRKMNAVQTELSSSGHAHAEEERLELEAQFRCLLELLCGVQDRILEFSENWIEALCAWGTLVQPAMKRDDLPEVVQFITDHLQPDGTLSSDMILVSLMRGDVTKSIKQCLPFDEWLAAHLGDLCSKALLLDESQQNDGAPLMDTVLFAWADTLLNEERLWRMALSYLAVVQTPAARSKMRGVLFSVPLMETDDADAQFKQVEEVLGACIEYGMDDEVRIICKIADQMLHDFVEHGAEQFIKSVDTIPRVLLDNAEAVAIEAGLTADNAELATPFATVSSIFSTETFAPLVFHVKYRDFLELFADKSTWADAAHILMGLLTSDVTPESFLTVLLVDALPLIQAPDLYFTLAETYELLRIVEKVAPTAAQTNAETQSAYYFSWLEQLLDRDAGTSTTSPATRRKLVQERMLTMRIAVAQYLSRVLVEGAESA